MVMVLDLMHIYNFCYPVVNGGKRFIIFDVDNSLSVHTDIKKNNILVLGEGWMDALDDVAQAKYSVNITKSREKIRLSLHCNWANSFLYVNGLKVYQFKAKSSVIKPKLLCLGNISKENSVNNIKSWSEWVSLQFFNISSSENIYQHLMKKCSIVLMLGFLNKCILFSFY